MANVKRLEVAYAEEKQLREKIINDRDKVIEENVALNTQIEELKRKLESVCNKWIKSHKIKLYLHLYMYQLLFF